MRWGAFCALGLVLACQFNTEGSGEDGDGAGTLGDGDDGSASGSPTTTPGTSGPSTAGPTTDPMTTTMTAGPTTGDPTTDATMTTDPTTGERGVVFRKPLTVPAAVVEGDAELPEFTVLVAIAGDADLRSVGQGGHVALANGADIGFHDGAADLAAEIVAYDEAAGDLQAWVLLPAVSPVADTVFYVQYGDDGYVPVGASAWNAGYDVVWHCDDAPGDGAIADSSPAGNDGTPLNLANTDYTGGRIGGGLSFSALNSTVLVGGSALDSPGPQTYEAWGRMDSNGQTWHRIIHKGASQNSRVMLWVEDNSATFGQVVYGQLQPSSVTVTHTIPAFAFGQWHHYAGVADTPGGQMRLYVDGVEVDLQNITGDLETGYPNTYFGNWDNDAASGRPWQGVLDEFRVSNVVRSQGWIATSFANVENPAGFVTVGAEEAL